jgi:hypothetical protein
MDTMHAIIAISRFTDVRGVPEMIISSNFQKADNDLQDWPKAINFNQVEEKTGSNA